MRKLTKQQKKDIRAIALKDHFKTGHVWSVTPSVPRQANSLPTTSETRHREPAGGRSSAR